MAAKIRGLLYVQESAWGAAVHAGQAKVWLASLDRAAIWRTILPEKFLHSCMLFARVKRLMLIRRYPPLSEPFQMHLGGARG